MPLVHVVLLAKALGDRNRQELASRSHSVAMGIGAAFSKRPGEELQRIVKWLNEDN